MGTPPHGDEDEAQDRPLQTSAGDQAMGFEANGIPAGTTFVVASEDILFAGSSEVACDACGARLMDDDEPSYRVRGEGIYMWMRGDVPRFEKAPLCPECAAAIGMTALARWEIEEEEG